MNTLLLYTMHYKLFMVNSDTIGCVIVNRQ